MILAEPVIEPAFAAWLRNNPPPGLVDALRKQCGAEAWLARARNTPREPEAKVKAWEAAATVRAIIDAARQRYEANSRRRE